MRAKSVGSLVIGPCSLISAGLFLARVALEATGRPWPWFLVVGGGLLAVLGSLALGRWLAVRLRPGTRSSHAHGHARRTTPPPSHPPTLPPSHTPIFLPSSRLWPALLLLIYVLWPRRDPVAAASVAVLALLVWLLCPPPPPPPPPPRPPPPPPPGGGARWRTA
jgi:hypothetical protein